MVGVVEDRHIPRDQRVITDAHAPGGTDDPTIVQAHAIPDDELSARIDDPGARVPDVDVVSDHDPSITADQWRGAFQVQSPPDSATPIPKHRLSIENLG